LSLENVIKELNNVSSIDKLGLICSTLIILFSFFGNRIDTLMTFLFGTSLFMWFAGMSFNADTKSKEEITPAVKITTTLHSIYLNNYKWQSKLFFFISLVLFFGMVARIVLSFLK